jgi:hypothetical protein
VIPQELEDKIDSILRKCKCSKVSVVTVAGDEPDTDQTNTFQELDGGVVVFVDCSGEAVTLNGGSPIDAADIANGSVSNTEFQFLNTVTSNIQTQLDGKSATGHTHDDRYFTEAEVTASLALKSNTGHTHVVANITDIGYGTYAPTIDNEVNLDSATIEGVANYVQVGSIVTVSGRFSATVTGAGAVSFTITLPVTAVLASPEQAAGTAVTTSTAVTDVAAIRGNSGEAQIIWTAADFGVAKTWSFHFTYYIA